MTTIAEAQAKNERLWGLISALADELDKIVTLLGPDEFTHEDWKSINAVFDRVEALRSEEGKDN